MARTVVVGTELTKAGGQAVDWAAAVAERTGGSLHLVHALELQPIPLQPDLMAGSFPALVRDAESRLEAEAARVGGIVASARVEAQSAHRAIVDRAREVDADLVVVGPHRGPGGGVLGTTADAVVRRTPAACLIARGVPGLPVGRVVVPVDLSPESVSALARVTALVVELGDAATEVHVICVIPELGNEGEHGLDRARLEDELNRAAEDALDAGLAETGEGGPRPVLEVGVVEAESPTRGVLHYAEWSGAALIGLATHGSGALKRALIGSVASSVARHAEVPVLLIPPASLE